MPEDKATGLAGHAAAAVLFMQAGTLAMDVYSAVNSSPWTAENFGADPEKAKSCREYVYHAIGLTAFYAGIGSYVSRSTWPLFGAAIMTGYMWWLYERALRRGVAAGTDQWASGDGGA